MLQPTDKSNFPISYGKLGAGGGGSDPQAIMRVTGNGCYDNTAPQRNPSQYQVRQTPPQYQPPNVKTEGSAPASVSDEKKFRRISDKS